MTKRKNRDEASEDPTHGQSIGEQAERYRLATAKFPIDALTPTWCVGSNRVLDLKHVKALCQTFEQQKLQRESVENRLRVACSRAELQKMMDHLGWAGTGTDDTASSWPSFQDWTLVNNHPAELMAGQHRVEALKMFLSKKGRLHTCSDDDPHWWLCDIYDRGGSPILPVTAMESF